VDYSDHHTLARPVWTSLPITLSGMEVCVCVFITVGPITKLFAWGGVDIGSGYWCVFITALPITKLFARGGWGKWRTCATRDYEPRPM
jgi:hypothetical protein